MTDEERGQAAFEALQQLSNAVMRAESDNHVPRVVVALESIAKSLEVLAAKHGEQRGVWPPGALGDHMAICMRCARQCSVNAAGWCFDCFSGKGPTQL